MTDHHSPDYTHSDPAEKSCYTCGHRCMDMDMEPYCAAVNSPFGKALYRGRPVACAEYQLWQVDTRRKSHTDPGPKKESTMERNRKTNDGTYPDAGEDLARLVERVPGVKEADRMYAILGTVRGERLRQEMLRRSGKFPATCATTGPGSLSPTDAFAVLGEEVGEVARHVTEWRIDPVRLDRVKLQKELVEVAAVAVAWAEKLAAEMAGEPNL